MVRPALVRDVPHMHMRTPMHLINNDHSGSWAASQPPITTTALIQPSNQSTCLYRIFLVNSFCPGTSRPGPTHQLSLMAGPTGLFNFTSSACASQLRITVSIPFITLSNYIEQPFILLYFVHHYLGGILFHGLSGNCINRQALSRRLTTYTASAQYLWDLRACLAFYFYDAHAGWEHRLSFGMGWLFNTQFLRSKWDYVHWSLSVDGNGTIYHVFTYLTIHTYANSIKFQSAFKTIKIHWWHWWHEMASPCLSYSKFPAPRIPWRTDLIWVCDLKTKVTIALLKLHQPL